MWHNNDVPVELDVHHPAPSSKPLDATFDEANEPVSQMGAVDFSKGHRMSGTTASDIDTTEPSAAVARPATIREFQRALRGMGFSERQAKAVASHGFKALGTEPEPAADLAGVIAKLTQITAYLKETS